MRILKVILILGFIALLSGCHTPRWARRDTKPVAPQTKTPPDVSLPLENKEVKHSVSSSNQRYLQEYHSLTWKEGINLPSGSQEKYYPDAATINPRTLRRMLDEYYLPMLSAELHTMVDYYEALDTFDNTFLSKYDIDLRAVPEKEAVDLIWKHKF